eukprot:SAG31_NODE_4384_length_3274_cov_23.439837_1_plen_55_part_00
MEGGNVQYTTKGRPAVLDALKILYVYIYLLFVIDGASGTRNISAKRAARMQRRT